MRKYIIGSIAGVLLTLLALAASEVRSQMKDQVFTTEE